MLSRIDHGVSDEREQNLRTIVVAFFDKNAGDFMYLQIVFWFPREQIFRQPRGFFGLAAFQILFQEHRGSLAARIPIRK